MNHLYRSLWNDVTRTFVAVAEVARGRGKRSSDSRTAGTGDAAVAPPTSMLRPMALEPRLMFDAAAVAATVDVVHADGGAVAEAGHGAALAEAAQRLVQAAPTAVPAPDERRDVVFIDASVHDWQTLAAGVDPSAKLVLLDPAKDGLTEMVAALRGMTGVDSIQVLSHGSEGQLSLGSLTLDAATVATRSADLAALGTSLAPGGDLLLYGCNVASGAGQGFLQALATATGADVAASTDATRSATRGGDWTLEASTGPTEKSLAIDGHALDAFKGDLAEHDVSTWADLDALLNNNQIQSGDRIKFHQDIDLQGQTITLPDDVTLVVDTASNSLLLSNGLLAISGRFVVEAGDGASLDASIELGGGTLAFNTSGELHFNGSLAVTGSSTIELSGPHEVFLEGGFSNTGSNTLTFTTAPYSLASVSLVPTTGSLSGADVILQAGVAMRDAGALADANSVSIQSDAMLTLSAGDHISATVNLSSNTYNGASAMALFADGNAEISGQLNVVGTGSLGVVQGQGATLTLSGGIAGPGTLFVDALDAQVALSGAGSTFTGSIYLQGGDFDVADAASLVNASGINIGDNAHLHLGSGSLGALLSGNGSATKYGSGTLSLTNTGNNGSWAGSLSVDDGTLSLSDGDTLPNGSVSMSANTTLLVTASTTFKSALYTGNNVTIQTDAQLILNGYVRGGSGDLIKTGFDTLVVLGTARSHHSGDLIVRQGGFSFSGGGPLDSLGTGLYGFGRPTIYLWAGTTLTLGNKYPGPAPASAYVQADIVLDGGSHTIAVGSTTSGQYSYLNTATVQGNITGYGSLTKTGSGTVSFASLANTGSLTVTGGTVSGNLGNQTITLNGGGIAAASTSQDIVLGTNGGSLDGGSHYGVISGSGSLTIDVLATTNNPNVGFQSHTVLYGANTYTGSTTVKAGATLQIANNAALGSISGGTTVQDGGTLQLDAGVTLPEDIALAGAGSSNSGNLEALWVSAGSATITGAVTLTDETTIQVDVGSALALNGTVSGAHGLTKAGIGRLTASGANTYSGATTVSAGTLVITGALAGTSGITVDSGATLAGTGSVFAPASGNTVTVTGGATLDPGVNGGAGMLTINGDLHLLGSAALHADIDGATAGTGHDQVVVSGNVTLDSGASLDVTLGYTPSLGDAYRLIDNTGGGAIAGSFTGLAEGATLTAGSTVMTARYASGTGNDFTLFAPSNITPVVANLHGDSTAYTAGSTVLLDAGSNALISDTEDDAANWNGGSLVVQRVTGGTADATANDVFGFDLTGAGFTVSGNTLQSGGQTFATFALSGGVLTVNFTGSGTAATTARVQDLVRHLSYRNDTPYGNATLRLTLTDSQGASVDSDVTLTSSTIYVDVANDDADGDAADGFSLREALTRSAAQASADTLRIVLSANSTVTLGSGVTSGAGDTLDLTAASRLTIAGSALTLGGALTLVNGSGDITTLAGALAGSATLTKAGAGTLTLSNTGNAAGWSGGLTVNAGSVSVSSDSRLTSGAITLDGGQLTLNSFGGGTLDNAIVLGASGGTVNASSSAAIASGSITGTGALSKTGGQLLTLTGNNTYSGGTAVSGTNGLAVNDASNLGVGTITLNTKLTVVNAATLANNIVLTSAGTVVNANALTLSGTLSGDSLAKEGVGRLTLTGTNTYTGTTTVSAGSLQVAGDSNLGAGALTLDGAELRVSANATIDNAMTLVNTATFNISGVDVDLTGVISGSGTLNKTGGSLLQLSGTNTRTGATHLQAGFIRIAGDANLGTGTAAITLDSGVDLMITGTGTVDNDIVLTDWAAIETTGAVTLTGALSGGAHELVKYGTGSLTLTNTANEAGLTGGVRIYDGALAVASDDALVGGTVVLNGGSLSLTGTTTVDNDIDLALDGTLTAQTGVTATFTGVVSDGSSLTLDGAGTVVLAGSNTYAGTTTVTAGTLSIASDANLGSDAVTLAGGQLAITGATTIDNAIAFNSAATVTTSADATLSGTLSGSGEMTKAGSSQLTLSGTNNASGGSTVQAGTLAVSADSQLSSGTLTLAGGTLAITGATTIDNAITVSSASTIDASADATLSGVISGSGALGKAGASTLTLSASNTHSGAVNITAGGLTVIGGASIADSSAVTVATGATLTLAGGAETIGSLAGAGNVVLGNYRLTTGGDNTSTGFSGVISGTGSGITKAGSGTFTLSGANTYTGATTVSAGTLSLGNGVAIADASAVTVAAGATLRLHSADETLASLAGAGTVTLNGGSLTLAGNSSTTFSGVIQDGSTGSRNLIKQGSGTLTLSGANTYSGTTTVRGGSLSVGSDSNLGSGTLTLDGGHLAITGTTTIDNAVALLNTAFVTVASGTATLSGAISGTATLAKDGAGTLVLSNTGNAASHSGTTEVRNGTLAVAGDANLGAGTITLNGGTLSVSGLGTIDNAVAIGVNDGSIEAGAWVTLSGLLSGSGQLNVLGYAGMVTLANSGNATSFTGTTNIYGGTVRVDSDANLGAGAVTLDGGYLMLTSATTIDNTLVMGAQNGTVMAMAGESTLTGSISGSGGMHSMGAMRLRIPGLATYTGYTWVEAGELEVTGALSGTAGVFVSSGRLTGTGSIGASGVTSDVQFQSTGKLAPGLSAGGIGMLALHGNLAAPFGAEFLYDVRGTTPGSGHDQITVEGTVILHGATLTLDFGSYAATTGETYVLISNDGSDAVLSPFNGTAEGSTFMANGRSFRISYVGGDGNDVTLTALNAAPTVANALTAQTATEDSAFAFTVPANTFADIDVGDTLTYAATLANGSALPSWLSFNAATRAFSGTPLNGDVGPITVRVTATDGGGASSSSDFTLTVANTNDAPTSNGIAAQSATEDAAFSFTVPANVFTDVDTGDTLSYGATQADGSALPAWLSFNPATRAFTGTPANADVGAITLKVTATDGSNTHVSSNFALTVANTNDAPTSMAIAAQAATEDSGFSFTVPANTFADVDVGDTLSYAATLSSGAALPGWLSFDATTRTFSGTPLNGDVGAITVRVTATDSGNAGASSNFVLTVANTNDAPTTTGIAAQTAVEDSAFSLTVPSNAFTDVDAGDALSYAATRADGSALPAWLSFNAATRTFSGTPANGDVGAITLKVTATDSSNATVSTSFTLTTTNTNDAPTASSIAAQSATEDSAFAFTVPANSFADIDVGDTLAYAATLADGSALPGWLSFDAATRSFSGTPLNGDVGAITVKVTATDSGSASASSNFVLTVDNTNDAPTTTGIAAQTAVEDSAFAFTVPSNAFTDVDAGDALSYGATLPDGSALPAWLSFNAATRTFSGTPANGDVGAITVKVTATDGSNAAVSTSFTLTTTNTNDAPTASGIAAQSATEDGAFAFTVPANSFADIDVGDTLAYAATLADGSVLPGWLSFDAATRSFSGTPLNGDVGAITVKVTATDSASASASSNFVLTVTNTNDAPTAVDIAAQAASEDGPFSFAVPASAFADADVGDTLTYSATLANGAALPAWLSFNAATRTFSGTPANGDVGAVSVKVTATDGSNASASSSFALTVANTNDAPTSIAIAAQAATEDAAFSFTVPASTFADVDVGDTLAYAATLADGSALPAWLSFNTATRTFSGTPANGDVGAITVKVTAIDGSSASASSSFALTVANTNDAPTGTAIAAQSATEDSAFSFTVPANTFADVDVGDTLGYAATLADGSTLPAWLSFNAATRTFSGTPANGDVGAVAVKVTATDGSNASASSNFTLTVANTNDAPTAGPIPFQSVAEDSAFAFTVPANTFADVDVGDTLTYTATLADGAALPAWLSFNATTRSFSGTPLNGDVGVISVKVTATDTSNASAAYTFGLFVSNTNDAPTAAAIAAQAATEDSAFSFTVPANTFTDVDVGDTLSYTALQANGSPLPAWLNFNTTTRTFSGTPTNGDVGTISVKVTATDASNASGSSNFTLTVANTNDAPTSNTIAAQTTTESSPFSFTVPAGTFTDVDTGDTLRFTATQANGAALPGWLSFDAATRTFSGTAAFAHVGSITVRVTATDGSGATASSEFALTVAASPPAPLVPVPPPPAPVPAPMEPPPSPPPAPVVETRAPATAFFSGVAAVVLEGRPQSDAATRLTAEAPTPAPAPLPASPPPAPAPTLQVVPQLEAIGVVGGGVNRTVDLPMSSFVTSPIDGGVTVQARLADGTPLPAWLRFDPATGKLTGKVPPAAHGVIKVMLTVRDSQGHAASTAVEIRLDDVKAPARPGAQAPADMPERLAARPGLSEQLRQARLPQRAALADRLTAAPRGEPAASRHG